MIDEVQQNFVRSFIEFLKKQIDELAFKPDAQESCEVAIQCLQAAFDLGEEETEEQAQPSSSVETSASEAKAEPISLFEIYETRYLEKNPDISKQAESIKNEGNRLMKNGRYNEALLQYNRAITYDPKNPIFYCNRAAAYIRLGDNDRAIIDCKSALVYNPNYGKAYGRLGIAYSNLGKYEEAQQAYAKAIELEPENQDYRNNLEVARNNRNRSQNVVLPQLTEGLNAMLSNPAIRNIFSTADIDLETLQAMSQNPAVMGAVGQLFAGMQGGGGMADAANSIPAMPNDMLQLFQGFAQQLSNAAAGANQPENADNNQLPSNTDQKQPPAN